MKPKIALPAASGAVALALLGTIPEFSPELLGHFASIINKYDLTFSAVIGLVALGLAVANRVKLERLEDRLPAPQEPGDDEDAPVAVASGGTAAPADADTGDTV